MRKPNHQYKPPSERARSQPTPQQREMYAANVWFFRQSRVVRTAVRLEAAKRGVDVSMVMVEAYRASLETA